MTETAQLETAADLAGNAALLEIVENLGASELLDAGRPFTAADLAAAAQLAPVRAGVLLDALAASGLVVPTGQDGAFAACAELADRRYESGYLSWAFSANRPYLDLAAPLLRSTDGPGAQCDGTRPTDGPSAQRDGKKVAVSSRWIGSAGFYPAALAAIGDCAPNRMVDLGAGAAGLLLAVLGQLPECTGVALDLSAEACAEAAAAAGRAGAQDRLEIVNRPIQSLVDDPTPVSGADVVHAGFVMHDLAASPDLLIAVLTSCREAMAPNGRMIVTDAVPYVANTRERSFSALFTYLHAAFMDVDLPSEQQWLSMFDKAGFGQVQCSSHRMPTGRMFVATR